VFSHESLGVLLVHRSSSALPQYSQVHHNNQTTRH